MLRHAWLVILVGCGGGGGPSAPDARPDGGDAPVARYQPPAAGAGAMWGQVPYPSDHFLDGDGRLAVLSLPVGAGADPQQETMLREALASLDGAGLRGNVYFPIEVPAGEAIDPATVGGAAGVVEVATGATIPGRTIWRDDLDALVFVPARGTVLAPGAAYAAYVTSAVRTTDGVALAADEGFAGPPAALAGIDDVVVATTFTTATFPAETRRIRDAVAARTPTVAVLDVVAGDAELDAVFGDQEPGAIPGTCTGGLRAQPHDAIAALVQGTITLTDFQGDDVFVGFDGAGEPVVHGTRDVRFSLTLPATTADWDALPVLIYLHGVNRTRVDFLTQANTAAELGAAMLAIDLPGHGDRDPGATDARNETLGTDTPDGFGDTNGLLPATRLFHLIPVGDVPAYHPRAMGENLRAAAIDLAQLVELVRDGDDAPIEAAVAALPIPDTFTFRDDVGLITESLGAMVGGVALAVEPGLGVAYLASPAAGFPAPSMLHSPHYTGLFATVVVDGFGVRDRIDVTDPDRDFEIDPIVMLYGNAIERGDAIAYAPLVTGASLRGGTPPDLAVAMAWGDVWVSNDTTEAYARALGLPHAPMALPEPPAERIRFVELEETTWPVAGNLAGGRTGAFVVFDRAGHASLRKYQDQREYEPVYPPYVEQDPIEIIFPNQLAQHHELWSELVSEHLAGAVSLTDPYADSDPETGGTACP